MPISTSVKVCNWHFVLPYIFLLIWALSRMSHVNPINKLAALLVYWWAKLLSSVAIEECELPALGIGSIELLGIHFSQLNLQPKILNELWTTYPNKIADVFFHIRDAFLCLVGNVWWGPWVHQTFCLMVHQTFSPTLLSLEELVPVMVSK